ncbi:hypothetical protein N9M41_07235 [Rhodopirellula sp.]|nr:hypothetical protein [Rhodopirellula sp.]
MQSFRGTLRVKIGGRTLYFNLGVSRVRVIRDFASSRPGDPILFSTAMHLPLWHCAYRMMPDRLT